MTDRGIGRKDKIYYLKRSVCERLGPVVVTRNENNLLWQRDVTRV